MSYGDDRRRRRLRKGTLKRDDSAGVLFASACFAIYQLEAERNMRTCASGERREEEEPAVGFLPVRLWVR